MLYDLNYLNISLKMASEVIWPHIWIQQPWLPWYPCAYCLQPPPSPWRPPNDLWGHLTSGLKSATLITLVSMGIFPPMTSEAMVASITTSEVIWPQIWHQKPSLPWYTCAYCLQWPLRPLWPPSWWSLTLPMTSEVTSELEFKLLDHDNPCYHASLASKCLQWLDFAWRRRRFTIHWPAWLRRR